MHPTIHPTIHPIPNHPPYTQPSTVYPAILPTMHMYVAEWIHVPQWCYTFFSCAFLTTLHGGTDAGGCLLPTLCLGAFSTTFFWFFSGTFFWIFSGWFFWIFSGWFFWTFPGWFFAGNFSGLLTAGSSRNSGLVSIERRIVEHSVWYKYDRSLGRAKFGGRLLKRYPTCLQWYCGTQFRDGTFCFARPRTPVEMSSVPVCLWISETLKLARNGIFI